jgi:hypothetical protein
MLIERERRSSQFLCLLGSGQVEKAQNELELICLMQFFLSMVVAHRSQVKVSHGGLSGHKSKMKFFSDYHCCAERHTEVGAFLENVDWS